MSFKDMERRARERNHPPSQELEKARQKMIACGNHPWRTALTEEEFSDSVRTCLIVSAKSKGKEWLDEDD